MIGLDTNVLVRYLVKDDQQQAELATTYIRRAVDGGERCYINCIVLCELVWVLESAYRYEKKEIINVLEKILITKQLELESKEIVRQAVRDYQQGQGDLADYLIGRINQAQGCTRSATFGRSLKNSHIFVVIE